MKLDKTPKMQEIEQKFGTSIEDMLKQKYEVEGKSTYEIGKLIGVGGNAVSRWLKGFNISIRSVSESMLQGKKKPSEEQLRQWYEIEGKTTVEIAEQVGINNGTISKWLHDYKIPVRNASEAHLNGKKKPSEEQLRQWYIVEAKNLYEIGDLVNVSAVSVRRWLHDYKIPTRNVSEAMLKGNQKLSKEQLRQLYVLEGKNTVEIAEQVGVGNCTVSNWLREYKIPVRSSAESKFGPSKNPGEEKLRQWYVVEGKNPYEIADLLSVSKSTIGCWLRDYKIPVRTLSEVKLKGKKKLGEGQLRQWYQVEKKSIDKISELVGVSQASVSRWLHDYKIPARNKEATRELKREALEKVIERYAA